MDILIESGGDYKPLQTFPDFEIKYTHRYDNANEISGRKVPYTENFKIPYIPWNKDLCGITEADIHPIDVKKRGKVLDNSGNLVFECVILINRTTTYTLQEYIEIQLMDKISYILDMMSKTNLSDAYKNIRFTWDDLKNVSDSDTIFTVAYHDWNGNGATYIQGTDGDINQLQPIFPLKGFLDDVFYRMGLGEYESIVLKENGGIAPGIDANKVGVMLPTNLKVFEDLSSGFLPWDRDFDFVNPATRTGIIVNDGYIMQMPSTMRMYANNDTVFSKTFRDDSHPNFTSGTAVFNTTGEIDLEVLAPGSGEQISVNLYGNPDDSGDIYEFQFTSYSIDDPNGLELWLIDPTFPSIQNGDEPDGALDYEKLVKIGSFNSSTITDDNKGLQFVFDLIPGSLGTINAVAGEHFQIAFVIRYNNGKTDITFDVTHNDSTFNSQWVFTVGDFTLEASNNLPDTVNDSTDFMWRMWTPGSQFMEMWVYSRDDRGIQHPMFTGSSYDSQYGYDLGKSFKELGDMKLLDVLSLIMERFNLVLATKGDVIHIDTKDNISSGETVIIDAYTSESVDIEYITHDKGLLTIQDKINGFEDDDFNSLKDYYVSPGRETLEAGFNSTVESDNMYYDEMNTNIDLLRINNDTRYWGMSEKTQAKIDDLNPTFCFLEQGEYPIYIPRIINSTDIISEDPIENVSYAVIYEELDSSYIANNAVNTMSGFSLISFEDNEILSGDNVFEKFYFKKTQKILAEDNITINLDAYINEDVFKKLIDFPFIQYKGKKYELNGVNEYDLSSNAGSICKLELSNVFDFTLTDPKDVTAKYDTFTDMFSVNWLGVVGADSYLVEIFKDDTPLVNITTPNTNITYMAIIKIVSSFYIWSTNWNIIKSYSTIFCSI